MELRLTQPLSSLENCKIYKIESRIGLCIAMDVVKVRPVPTRRIETLK